MALGTMFTTGGYRLGIPAAEGGGEWRGNEPASMTLITDWDCTSLPDEGWAGFNDYDLVSDATGPQSPSGTFSNIYPLGWGGGDNPGLAEIGFTSYRTLYQCMYVKHSSNFQGHGSNVNKITHIWVGAVNHLFLNAAGNGSDSLIAQIRLQGIVAGGSHDGGTAGIYDNNSIELVRDTWNLLEVVAVSNTGSNLDGSVDLYVNGDLAAFCSGIEFETGGPLIDLEKLDPTWGGTGETVDAEMFIRFDHVYMSGKN